MSSGDRIMQKFEKSVETNRQNTMDDFINFN